MKTTSQTWPVGPSILALVAVVLTFAAGRLFEDVIQSVAFVVAVTAALAGGLWRVQSAGQGSGRQALIVRGVAAHAAVAAGAALIAVVVKDVVGAGDGANIAMSLGLLLVVGGGAILWSLELLLAATRATGVVDLPRVERATQATITLVVGTAALVAIVYGTQKNDVRLELAYAAPTSPSGATAALVDVAVCGDAAEKPEAFLFFERGSTALGEVKDYFDGLAAHGMRLTVLDQALDPALAKDLKVTKNGTVAFRCGAKTESYVIGAERDDAQRKLRKLDNEVRTKLGKITRDPVNVYFTVGHGERAYDGSDKSGRTMGKSLKKLLDAQNATTKKLGLADGLADKVPDDAGLVVVFGPTAAFRDEEVQSLIRYVDGGGALALFIDPPRPGTDDVDVAASFAPLAQSLGLSLSPGEVMNDKEFVKQSGTAGDHIFVFSTSFGTHKAIKTLNGARGKAALLFLSSMSLKKIEAAASPKVSLIARSRPATFVDENGNRRFDEGTETRGIVDFAAVVEKKVDGASDGKDGKEGRALVVGDSDVVADTLLQNEANAVFAYETLLWLLRDDRQGDASGAGIAEDAPIRHTRDEDTLWFYGTTLLGPGLIILVGVVVTRLRRRRSKGPQNASGGAA
jgi:hypothetical protein